MPAVDRWGNESEVLWGPCAHAATVTPSDSVAFTENARALYVGVAGDVTLVTLGGETVLFKAVPAGTLLPVRCTRVNNTATTAANMLSLW